MKSVRIRQTIPRSLARTAGNRTDPHLARGASSHFPGCIPAGGRDEPLSGRLRLNQRLRLQRATDGALSQQAVSAAARSHRHPDRTGATRSPAIAAAAHRPAGNQFTGACTGYPGSRNSAETPGMPEWTNE